MHDTGDQAKIGIRRSNQTNWAVFWREYYSWNSFFSRLGGRYLPSSFFFFFFFSLKEFIYKGWDYSRFSAVIRGRRCAHPGVATQPCKHVIAFSLIAFISHSSWHSVQGLGCLLPKRSRQGAVNLNFLFPMASWASVNLFYFWCVCSGKISVSLFQLCAPK